MINRLWARRAVLKTVAGATVAGSFGAKQSRAQAPLTRQYTMLIFSDPVPGREDEYNEWYDKRHLPDLVAVPGFVRARRLKLAPVQLHQSPPLHHYLAFFEISTDNLPAVFAEVDRRRNSGVTVMSDAFDLKATVGRAYRMLDDLQMAPGLLPLSAAQDAEDGFHIVFNAPKAGMDAAFNAWYEYHHLPDMLSIPGFVRGQRGTSGTVKSMGGPPEPPYVAIFRFAPGDMAALAQRFTAAMPYMHMEPVMAMADGYTFLPHGPVLDGDAVRAKRGAVT